MSRLEIQNVSYAYNQKKMVLKDLSYCFEDGKIYAIVGKSGAGKTTLLSLLSKLTSPKSGEILVNGKSLSKINQYQYRSQSVGVIFQSYNLLPQLNAIENVVLSMDIAGNKQINKQDHAKQLLNKVGLEDSDMHRKILKLSGGQQQRVAIARALSYNPAILLADEPTGNLDAETQDEIMNIFKQLAYEENKCIIIVTHSKEVASSADEIYRL
ncbi:MAG: ABC transporter ATP-binding protein [Erysipelotrichia bacterium]|nr:ABC transporter ATP-binding protein [Erysipelotrichia bacterium]NCC54929.1 ABC transporter ATP-binding protein [Erysipelotrichia bacterium]